MILLTPGPTEVLEKVRVAMAKPAIHHRTKEFESIFASTRELLNKLFKMDEVVMLASSGTGAMEAAVTNLTTKKALIINAGKFGERFGKICEAFGIEKVELKYEWDTPADVNDVIEAIKQDSEISSVCIQVCESSGGLRHPVEEIAKEVKKINSDIIVIADGITAVGVEEIDVSNIDALISGSQKALMLPPGLAMIGLSKKALDLIENNSFGYYFNLKSEIKKQRANTTAYTAATSLIIGLNESLKSFFDRGLDRVYAETKKRANAANEALKALGLKIYPKTPAISMSAVYFEKANEIRKILKEKFEVQIAGGQEHLKGKLFRINHMGLIEPYKSAWVLNAIEMALDELNIRKFDGSANKIFMERYFD